jgi:lipopolysaccharide export system protein LptA
MMMTMNRTVIAGVAAAGVLAVVGGAAFAQTSAGARSNVSNQPIMVGADGGERTNTGFALRGRAEVTQGQNRLRADSIVGTNAEGQNISTVTATGNVYYVTPNETIRGDRAVYTVSNGTIIVTGDVILTQGKNVLTGGRLSYNIDTGQTDMAAGGNGRIQGVFYPQGAN